MIVKDCITTSFPFVKMTDSPLFAYEQLKQFGVKHIPVINDDQKLIGFLSEEELMNDIGAKYVATLLLHGYTPEHVFSDDTLFHVLRICDSTQSESAPVVDHDQRLVGLCFKLDVYKQLATSLHYEEPGTELFILAEKHNFQMHDLLRIIEQEGATVLVCISTAVADEESLIRICVKLLANESLKVVSAIRRHGYVLESVSDKEYEVEYNERADEFLHYLNI